MKLRMTVVLSLLFSVLTGCQSTKVLSVTDPDSGTTLTVISVRVDGQVQQASLLKDASQTFVDKITGKSDEKKISSHSRSTGEDPLLALAKVGVPTVINGAFNYASARKRANGEIKAAQASGAALINAAALHSQATVAVAEQNGETAQAIATINGETANNVATINGQTAIDVTKIQGEMAVEVAQNTEGTDFIYAPSTVAISEVVSTSNAGASLESGGACSTCCADNACAGL